jgi:hypothetical protein
MQAARDNEGNTILTLSPDEAHVLIWGGPSDLVSDLEGMLRTTLVGIEDNQMTDDEYRERFDVLDNLYARLREPVEADEARLGKEQT